MFKDAYVTDSLARQNEYWRARRLAAFTPRVRAIVREHIGRCADYRQANQETARLARELKAAHLTRAYDEQAVRDAAEHYAQLCRRIHLRMRQSGDSELTEQARALMRRLAIAEGIGLKGPSGRSLTLAGRTSRLDCPRWWRRQLRKLWTRAAEDIMRELGIIRAHREPYASDDAVAHRRGQRRRTDEWTQAVAITNELNESVPMSDVREASVSNPALRRGEFMTRVRGLEEISADLRHCAQFATLTAPSAFHAQLAAGGANPHFARETVRQAQRWLCRQWARARAALKRRKIRYYGVRVAEPHHDATPHWHVLLFSSLADAERLRQVISRYWLAEYAEELGAAAHRVKFETIDSARGSAVGYIAKYISKNIDGAGQIGTDTDEETGAPITHGIARVDAWASIHGIRQFQVLGAVPVGLWREARRLREPVPDRDIERARLAADRGDWRAFSYAATCGEPLIGARRCSLKLEKAETGIPNVYGECRSARIIGLRYASAVEFTRPHHWTITYHRTSAVMNPPARAARIAEARNRNAHCVSGSGQALRIGTSEARTPILPLIFSDLGPVAITVPSYGSPNAWSNPMETSRAGP